MKFFLVLLLIALAAVAYYYRMSPEEREMMELKEKNEALARARVQEEQVRKVAEIAQQKEPFLKQITSTYGLLNARFSDSVIQVQFPPATYENAGGLQTLCNSIARDWATHVGLAEAKCEAWHNQAVCATGLYQGPVPKAYTVRAGARNLDEQQRELAAFSAMKGKTMAELEQAHGAAKARDAATGWATWDKFRARFVNGRVAEAEKLQ